MSLLLDLAYADHFTHVVAFLVGRSQHFKAQLSAGMRDANDHSHLVHDDFSEGAMRVFLSYLYQDELSQDLEPNMVVEVARVSCYYGTPR